MLKFTNLAIRRGPQLLLESASAELFPKQKAGLTGANGCGKSSLLALILGELEADHGNYSIPADWVVAHVAQSVPHSTLDARQYVLEGDEEWKALHHQIIEAEKAEDGQALAKLHQQFEELDGYGAPSRASMLLSGLGFCAEQMTQVVNHLSGGWKMRLNLARALMSRSDLLLLDEPTNHLDLDAIIWLQAWLERYQGTLVMISHDREFLDAVVRTIFHIEQGKLTTYKGNYSDFEQQRAAKLALQSAAHAKQQREISQMEAFVTRFKAKATKAKQAQSRVKALERMQRIAPAHIDSAFKFKFQQADKTPDSLIKIVDTGAGYGATTILKSINLGLVAGDRIGLIGANGAGKSTLIKLIENSITPLEGGITRSKHLQVGYFAQHQLDQFSADRSPFDYLSEQQPQFREQEVYDHLGGFDFKKARADEPVQHFSGGEKARLALALLVAQRPNLLLLDEPTNHLDLQMRHALTLALQSFNGALVVVSHDRFLLRSVADKLVLVHNGTVQEFDGDLEDYRQRILKARSDTQTTEQANAKELEPSSSKKDQRRARAELREKLKPLIQQVATLEKELTQYTNLQSEIDAKLMDENIYDSAKTQELTALLKEKSAIDKKREEIETRWLEQALELEEAEQAES